jgi:hypothetical protein
LYNVLLSPEDDSQLGGFADTLAGELETYLVGYARERTYSLATRPVVRFLVDGELRLGRFEVIGELLSPDEMAEELGEERPTAEASRPPASAESAVAPGPVPRHITPVETGFFDAETADDDLASAEPVESNDLATVTVRGVDHDVVLRGDRMVIGRVGSCDICLPDANVSREHAALVREGAGWAIEDLGSTNGTLIHGLRIHRARLRDGDVFVVGITELVYHEPRS